MIINIKEKIEQINKEPEHIRMMYVWICVAASMFIIFIVWVFSIFSMFTNHKINTADNNNTEEIGKQLQDLREQAASLKSLGDKSIDDINKGIANQGDTTNSVSSQENVGSAVPQSKDYLKLSAPDSSASAQQ